MLICKFCDKECKNNNSHRNHERTCKLNENRQISVIDYSKRNMNISNQYIKARKLGLPIPTSPCKGRPGNIGYKHNDEFRQKMSVVAKNRGLGGIRQSKRIAYNGKVLGSSYELQLVQSLDENFIRWNTCSKFNYIDSFGKNRTYTPDIYLIDYNVYLDPKNDFLINNINPSLGFTDKEKIDLVMIQNDIKVFILDKTQLSWEYIKTLL